MTFNYIIRDYQNEDEEAVLKLIQMGLGGGPSGTREKSFWQWKHFENPFGKSITLVAVAESGELIGLRTFMRWKYRVGESNINAVRAVDTVTHPEYRRYGVFSKLTSEAVTRVRSDGADLIFNTPNEQVLPGYLKLGWHYVSLVQPMVKILNYPRFISTYLLKRGKGHTSGQLRASDVFTRELPKIVDFLNTSRGIQALIDANNRIRANYISTNQSIAYLSWRYSGHHFGDYRILSYEKNNKLLACAILRPSTRFGLKEVVIVEILLSSTDEEIVASLLREMKNCVCADHLIGFFPQGSIHRRSLRKFGFHQVPRQGQNFTVNLFNANCQRDPLSFHNWHLSLGDLEVF